MDNENFSIQIRISKTMFLIGFFVVVLNLFRIVFVRKLSIIIAVTNPSVYLVLTISVILLLTTKVNQSIIKYFQVFVLLINATVSIMSEYDSFYGIGSIILSIFLSYRYGFFERYLRIKIVLSGVLFLFILEYSIKLSQENQVGSSLNVITYIFFFISMSYLIYMNEIKNIFKLKNDIYPSINEREDLEENIGEYKQKILVAQKRLNDIELSITSQKNYKKSLDFKREYGITPREVDVIKEFCKNPHLTTKEIACNLNMSFGTVKQHFNKIFKKMGVRSRSELINICQWNFIEV